MATYFYIVLPSLLPLDEDGAVDVDTGDPDL